MPSPLPSYPLRQLLYPHLHLYVLYAQKFLLNKSKTARACLEIVKINLLQCINAVEFLAVFDCTCVSEAFMLNSVMLK